MSNPRKEFAEDPRVLREPSGEPGDYGALPGPAVFRLARTGLLTLWKSASWNALESGKREALETVLREFLAQDGRSIFDSEYTAAGSPPLPPQRLVSLDLPGYGRLWLELVYAVCPDQTVCGVLCSAAPQFPEPVASVLVAEDSNDVYAVLELFLRRAGYAVQRIHDGAAAVEAALRCRYQAILMDVEMPGLDGLEATRVIRSFEHSRGLSQAPIVAITAHASDDYFDVCTEAGCTSFLPKPVSRKALLQTLQLVISGVFPEDEEIPAGPESDLTGLVPDFLENTREEVRRVSAALECADWRQIRRVGHTLKGAAYLFRFAGIGRLADLMEAAGRAQDAAAVRDAAQAILLTLDGIRLSPEPPSGTPRKDP